MGAAIELITGFATAPGATATGVTLASGNTLTVRNATPGSPITLLSAWVDSQGAGFLRVRSPNLHDNVQGIRADHVVSDLKPLIPLGFGQPLLPQDNLTVELTGSATAGDIETACLLLHYADLPGAAGRFASPGEIMARLEDVVNVENTLATGTAGGYSGEEAIDAEFDLLKANREYALLGFMTDTECSAVRYRGADIGNYGIGGPGDPDLRDLTADWFVRLSEAYQLPMIPVFNAANKSGILIDAAQDENGADPTVVSIFAALRA